MAKENDHPGLFIKDLLMKQEGECLCSCEIFETMNANGAGLADHMALMDIIHGTASIVQAHADALAAAWPATGNGAAWMTKQSDYDTANP